MTNDEINKVLERYDKTDPERQREITAALVEKYNEATDKLDAAELQLNDCGMLIRRMAKRLEKLGDTSRIGERALDFLVRKKIAPPTILRTDCATVCRAAKSDGIICPDNECDRANGDR
jgi:hypothetical protein